MEVKYEEGESYATPVLNIERSQVQEGSERFDLDRRRSSRLASQQASRKLMELSQDANMVDGNSDDDFMPS